MALKNLLVHLDQGPEHQRRLDLAIAIARQHDAKLVGLFAQRAAAIQVGVVAAWPPAEYAEAASASQSAFVAATAGVVEAEWQDGNRGSDAALLQLITQQARYYDLVVLGQHHEGLTQVPSELADELILHAGRPVLVMPYVGIFRPPFQHPLLLWDDSREAARALNDALPLIQDCQQLTVLGLNARHEQAEAASRRVLEQLRRHGIVAQAEPLIVEEIGVMDMVLNRAADLASDLLILGARHRAGFALGKREEGSELILRTMTAPTLLAG